jgi:hypothetical protein
MALFRAKRLPNKNTNVLRIPYFRPASSLIKWQICVSFFVYCYCRLIPASLTAEHAVLFGLPKPLDPLEDLDRALGLLGATERTALGCFIP